MREENKKQNKEKQTKERDKKLNEEITNTFLYFFTCILLNYQEYIIIKYEKNPFPNQTKDNIDFYKRPYGIEKKYINNDLVLTNMFNTYGFINNAPALDRPFYEEFFKTKIFYHFIKKKIFPMSVLDKLEVLFFDEKINEKLSRELKFKKIETKFLNDKFEALSNEIYIESMKQEISEETKEFLCNEQNCDRGLNYFQYIVKEQLEKVEENNQEIINSIK